MLENVVYLAARGFDVEYDEATWWNLVRLRLAFETGWTLDVIDNLSLEEIGHFVSYWSGLALAQKAADGH